MTQGKYQVQAFEAGRAARRAEQLREDPPVWVGSRRSLEQSWLAGWDAEARDRAEAAHAARELDEALRRPSGRPVSPPGAASWPAGEPLPTRYPRQQVLPCPTCRRVLDDDGRRAVVVRSVNGGVAYLRCRAGLGCPDWKLPVEP